MKTENIAERDATGRPSASGGWYPPRRVDGLLVDQIMVMAGVPLRSAAVSDECDIEHRLLRSVRRARTIVAEYARAGGMRDPEAIAEFSRSCVGESLEKSDVRQAPATLGAEAMRIAVERFGLGALSQVNNSRLVTDPATKASEGPGDGSRNIFVPQQTPQVMPSQPLGELPTLMQAKAWRQYANVAAGWFTVVASRLRRGY
jgi:hypothetical protein